MRQVQSTEDKILESALYLIGQNRDLNVSIRAISRAAGVNVSAINYYFRTKDEMIRRIKLYYLDNTKSVLEILQNQELSDEKKLVLGANEIMEYNIRYPGVMVVLREALKGAEDDEVFAEIVEVTNEMHSLIEKNIEHLTSGSKLDSKQKMTIFMSAIVYPIENIDILNLLDELLESREGRFSYISNVLELFK